MRRYKALVVAALLLACGSVGAARMVASAATNAAGEFTGLAPARILDTRDGNGRGGVTAPLGPLSSIDVQVTGLGGVPATNVSAVVLNATVTQPTAGSWLTVWPTGTIRNQVSNLNFDAGQTVANLVTVAVGNGGQVSVFNQFGATHVIFDVAGYYATTLGTAGARYIALPAHRLFDTRNGAGSVPVGRVDPASDLKYHLESTTAGATITAVILNVTAVEPTAAGWLTAYPDDAPLPLASNVNFAANQNVPNLVTLRLPASGNIAFHTAGGAAYLVADVVGFYATGATTNQGRFVPIVPDRVADSRSGAPIAAGQTATVTVGGNVTVPHSADAVVINVTATQPTANGWFTAFPRDYCALPGTSSLNFVPGQTVPNMVVTPLSKPAHEGCSELNGAIGIFNSSGTTHYVVDVFGYFTPA